MINCLNNPNKLKGKEYELLVRFWKQYYRFFDKETRFFIKRDILSYYGLLYAPALYESIYSYLGILDEKLDIYTCFFNYLKETHSNFLDKNILEVGCGSVPALTKIIADDIQYNQATGSITGMDNKLIIKNLDNANLIKEHITMSTNISNFDNIIGICPCEAAPIAITRACLEKKELSILMCGCIHNFDNQYFDDYDEYINYIFSVIKQEKNKDFTFNIDFVEDHFDYEYPILTLKRK